jgi:hypothetical protein
MATMSLSNVKFGKVKNQQVLHMHLVLRSTVDTMIDRRQNNFINQVKISKLITLRQFIKLFDTVRLKLQ